MSIINNILNNDFLYWEKEKQSHSIKLFHGAATRVPAYKDFLRKNGVNIKSVQSFNALQAVPPVTKKNYLTQYSLPELSWDGKLTQPVVYTSSSGSMGEPFYFHRSAQLDEQHTFIMELFYKHGALAENVPTLAIICFGMGVWIGGIISYQAFYNLQRRGYPVSIVTPGVNKKEIFSALKKLLPYYDNVILGGYPPFVKDILDEAPLQGISFSGKNIRIQFAAESFTEDFRDYIIKHANIQSPCRDTMNIYGSADIGTMAFESPLCILLRRLCNKNKNLFKALFGGIHKTPTLAQFIPSFTSFESSEGSLLVTGDSSLPLVRYAIGDNGGVISFKEMCERLLDCNIDWKAEAKHAGIENLLYQLPFVYVYERTDLSAKLYGAIIYPEYVKAALLHRSLEKYVTGKFTMLIKHNEKQDEYLEINIELKKDVHESPELKEEATKIISESLINKSAEHRNNMQMIPEKVKPKIFFWQHEHPLHFQSGTKQKWTKK